MNGYRPVLGLGWNEGMHAMAFQDDFWETIGGGGKVGLKQGFSV